LRATVGAAPRFLTINTQPQGLPVKVDGIDFVAPVSFAIVPFASTAGGAREWIEGSQHRIEVPETVTRNHAGGSVQYRFAEWTSGAARQFTITASRDVALTQNASFVALEVSAPPIAPPPPRPPNGPNPLLTALADAPKGPFLRITDGNLTLPNLAGNNFEITGELFLSLSRIQGQLATTAFAVPNSGSKFLEIGPSNWRVDATAGGSFLLEARPPSLAVLGYDVLPDGVTRLQFQPGAGATPATWTASFQLLNDFKPFPDMLEFKKGRVAMEWQAVSGVPAFNLALDGGIRLVRLPNGFFALDRTVQVRINTVDFNIGLNDVFDAAGQSPPANLFASGPFTVGWSDVRLQRSGGGPITLSLVGMPFSFNDNLIATVGGSLSTEGTLRINGTLGQNGVVRIDPNNRFTLEVFGSSTAFTLEISPRRLALSTPSMVLTSTDPALSEGVVIPGVRFDSSGAFDTGKIALPAIEFDGLDISGPSNGTRAKNYIQFQRDNTSRTTLTIKAEQQFVTCRQNLALTMTSVNNGLPTVTGSMSGNFCILPEPVSLRFNSGSSCQFSGSAFGFTVFFGSSCAGVRNDFTNLCILGSCQ